MYKQNKSTKTHINFFYIKQLFVLDIYLYNTIRYDIRSLSKQQTHHAMQAMPILHLQYIINI
jgi:hypothetical protein